MIQRALRDGWIKSIDRADDLLELAIGDVAKARETLHDPVEMAKLSNALARTGALVAGVYSKAVETSEDADVHNHLHLHGDAATMSTEAIRARLAELVGPKGGADSAGGT